MMLTILYRWLSISSGANTLYDSNNLLAEGFNLGPISGLYHGGG